MTKYITRGQVPLTDPVATLKSWLEISQIKDGAVFRRVFKDGSIGKNALSSKAVLLSVKNRMKLLGRDDWNDFSAHSMRSGFASVAAENGASIQAIKGQGGWKSDRTAMRYIRKREGWETTAASKLGL
jgi:integrase